MLIWRHCSKYTRWNMEALMIKLGHRSERMTIKTWAKYLNLIMICRTATSTQARSMNLDWQTNMYRTNQNLTATTKVGWELRQPLQEIHQLARTANIIMRKRQQASSRQHRASGLIMLTSLATTVTTCRMDKAGEKTDKLET